MKSAAAVGRCCGSLLKHFFRKSCNSGEANSGRGGISSSTIRNMALMATRSWYGGCPLMSSQIVAASDQMSLAVVDPAIEMTSGATARYMRVSSGAMSSEIAVNSLQFGVPLISFTAAARPLVVLMAWICRDTPKSESLMFPFFVESTLAAAQEDVSKGKTSCSEAKPVSLTLQVAMHNTLCV